jgi:hypothetical protein
MNYYNLVKKTVKEVGVIKVTKEICLLPYSKCHTIYLKNGDGFTVAFKDKNGWFFDNGEFFFGYRGEVVKVNDYFMKQKLKKLMNEIHDTYLSEKWNKE